MLTAWEEPNFDLRSVRWLEWTLWARLIHARQTGADSILLAVPDHRPETFKRIAADMHLQVLQFDDLTALCGAVSPL